MEDDIPEGIGPHEGRELALMLAGTKPLAKFNDDLPPEMEPPELSFDPHVDAGRFIKGEIVLPFRRLPGGTLRYYFYALPGEAWRMARMIEIMRALFIDRVPTTPELETEMGRLLGYDEADIKVFVDRFFADRRRPDR